MEGIPTAVRIMPCWYIEWNSCEDSIIVTLNTVWVSHLPVCIIIALYTVRTYILTAIFEAISEVNHSENEFAPMAPDYFLQQEFGAVQISGLEVKQPAQKRGIPLLNASGPPMK